jgi:hypothetical protein
MRQLGRRRTSGDRWRLQDGPYLIVATGPSNPAKFLRALHDFEKYDGRAGPRGEVAGAWIGNPSQKFAPENLAGVAIEDKFG